LIIQEGAIPASQPFTEIKAVSAVIAVVVVDECIPTHLKGSVCGKVRFHALASLFSLPLFRFIKHTCPATVFYYEDTG